MRFTTACVRYGFINFAHLSILVHAQSQFICTHVFEATNFLIWCSLSHFRMYTHLAQHLVPALAPCLYRQWHLSTFELTSTNCLSLPPTHLFIQIHTRFCILCTKLSSISIFTFSNITVFLMAANVLNRISTNANITNIITSNI